MIIPRTGPRSVLCIVGMGGGRYGYGHILRMLHLKKNLEKKNIDLNIQTSSSYQHTDSRVVLIDKRDKAFPRTLTKKKQHVLIALDNRGYGREQADIVWDSLPHPEMSAHEFKNTFRKFLLPDYLAKQAPKVGQACLRYLPRVRPNRRSFSHTSNAGLLKAQAVYLSQMKHEKKEVVTYFGQGLFEAIYLGKRVSLVDISSYHQSLSRWFIHKWSGLQDAQLYFDGKGMERLARLIADIV